MPWRMNSCKWFKNMFVILLANVIISLLNMLQKMYHNLVLFNSRYIIGVLSNMFFVLKLKPSQRHQTTFNPIVTHVIRHITRVGYVLSMTWSWFMVKAIAFLESYWTRLYRLNYNNTYYLAITCVLGGITLKYDHGVGYSVDRRSCSNTIFGSLY